jgi:putative spermidine/putrescine transport system ATP-binding protein
MLDVSVNDIVFPKSTHTAVVGKGTSALLQQIVSGPAIIGTRDVSKLSSARRPLLYVTREISPLRWSVRHLLVAAVRQRSLDRIDRQREFDLAASKWELDALLDRPLKTLSTSERTRANIARIELLKPAILVADGVVDRAPVAAEFYRILRVMGTTVISSPASVDELGYTDAVLVLDEGRVVQQGTFSHVYRKPVSPTAAIATGSVNLIPVTIRGGEAHSPIGSWPTTAPDGDATIAVRPEHFSVAGKNDESDFIFGVEEATFHGDHWRASGFLTGNGTITVALPPSTDLHKGKLLALRYDPALFTLFQGTHFAASAVFRYSHP